MPKAFSKDLRERVVQAYRKGTLTIQEVANLFSISKSAVEKYLRISRQSGDLTPLKGSGRPPVLDKKNPNRLKMMILSSSDKRLIDYSISFEEKTGIHLPISTLWNACKKMNIRRKKRVFIQVNKSQ